MSKKPNKAAAATFWSAAYFSVWNGVAVVAVTSGVLGFLLVAKRYL
ncbi:hypothetical protein JQ633_28045 [Bradyrhizobium tropiciagri]|nr:hypothetical protein [Bradyrhizobium tropiciagri]MBR0874243.1 hypothetical protein [Bradyrhizobium tropiciagri]